MSWSENDEPDPEQWALELRGRLPEIAAGLAGTLQHMLLWTAKGIPSAGISVVLGDRRFSVSLNVEEQDS